MNSFVKKYRKIIGIFLFWILIQLLLFSITGFGGSNRWFFPFEGDLNDYDVTEFVFYTLSPILLFFLYLCFRQEINKLISKLVKIKIIVISAILYLIWHLINIILLLSSDNFKMDGYFYPFTKSKYYKFADVDFYNISEFLVYSLVPLIVFILLYLMIKKRNKQLLG